MNSCALFCAISYDFRLEAPKLVNRPKSLTAKETEDIELLCSAIGKPKPTISWYRNGEILTPSEYYQVLRKR